jgi:hypothetical protein
MPDNRDHYQAYYQDKLWNLLPSIYRTLDTDSFTTPGPLREMVNRIGAQAAILRRSIDRLWEDQSIESCDDWVIAYIGDLLATNLVASLDARGQRLDVAKTIYYRRRKGTVALLEEIASDVTGWDARVVEFFRRMGRTRHNFDPEIGASAESPDPAGTLALQLEEGLLGFWSRTGIGGWADLRNRYGATKSLTAFDEFYHTADFRRGRDMVGWHNIPKLGVFLWRLYSFGVDQSTPVMVKDCSGQFTFDPTGREIALYAAASRKQSASYGEQWVSPFEWQLPGPIATPLMQGALRQPATIPLYAAIDPADGVTLLPNTMGVFTKAASGYSLLDIAQFIDPVTKRTRILPESGRFRPNGPINGEALYGTYHYAFSSTIGAGPFDRRIPGIPVTAPPQPVTTVKNSAAVVVTTPVGTTVIGDSLTYDTISDAAGIKDVSVQAASKKRPVFRLPAAAGSAWTLTGDAESHLSLEGLLISGGDVILRGKFARVSLVCCTLDPGNTGETSIFAQSVDQRDLRPSHLWIEAEVRELVIDRCITGPIRARDGGSVQTVSVNDSILQSIREAGFGVITAADIADPAGLALALRAPSDLSGFVRDALDATTQAALSAWDGVQAPDAALMNGLITGINSRLNGPSIYTAARFGGIGLSPQTRGLLSTNPSGADLVRLNRLLIESAYPEPLGQTALAMPVGVTNLRRCTVLGSLYVHRLEASECILDDFSVVEDTQHGCVRFSASALGSILPRQYECAQTNARAALFTSRQFGDARYAQLLPTADNAIQSPAGATILEGAEDGSEMGAFAREKNPIKERSLMIKFQEFMPLGLVPVVVHAT